MYILPLLERYPIHNDHLDLTKPNHTMALHVVLPFFVVNFVYDQVYQEMAIGHHVGKINYMTIEHLLLLVDNQTSP